MGRQIWIGAYAFKMRVFGHGPLI